MSLTKRDRKFRSGSGRSFPPGDKPPGHDLLFAEVIADALKREFGESTAGIRAVASLAGVSERAAKNWFDAKNAPNGTLLVRLIEHSDGILDCVLLLARREQLLKAKRIQDTRRELLELLSQLHELLS